MGGWGGRRIEAASSVPGTGLALSPQVSMDRTLQSRGWVVWCRLLTIVSRVFSHGPKASPTWSQPKALSKSPNPSSPSFCQPADSSSQARCCFHQGEIPHWACFLQQLLTHTFVPKRPHLP